MLTIRFPSISIWENCWVSSCIKKINELVIKSFYPPYKEKCFNKMRRFLSSYPVIYQLAHWLHQLLLHNLRQESKQRSSTPSFILSTVKGQMCNVKWVFWHEMECKNTKCIFFVIQKSPKNVYLWILVIYSQIQLSPECGSAQCLFTLLSLSLSRKHL